MKTKICDDNNCTGCRLCLNVCPKQCISIAEDECGFDYPVIDHTKCIDCTLCRKKCPSNNEFVGKTGDFYMAINKDVKVLKESSSGGVFSALASYVLNRGGVVFGAQLDEKTKVVEHVCVNSESEMYRIRKSKYYQSNMGNIFKKVLEELKKDKLVLFSGTACQIVSIYSFVPRKYYDNLITVDVLCHGVSSKKIVDSYIASEEKRFGKKIKSFQFRIKESFGWQSGGGTKMKLVFEDDSFHIDENVIDDFFLAFNNNVALRESCYVCKYCGIKRISDFTISDFWGVKEERASKELQNNGVSILVCNSDKSKNVLCLLYNYLYIEKITRDEAIPYNNAFTEPNKRPNNRDEFTSMMKNNENFNKIMTKLYRKDKMKKEIKLILGLKIVDGIKRIKNGRKS